MQKKIKNILNKIKEKISENPAQDLAPATKEDDQLLDYLTPIKNKIKQAFKKNTVLEENEEETQNENLDIDFTPIKKIMMKYSVIACLLLAVALQFAPNEGYLPWGGIWMRLQTEKLPLLDDFAQNSVYNFYRSQISNAISQQYPNLPQDNKNKLIDDQLNKAISENRAQIEEQTRQTAQYLKESMQYEENGQKYTIMPDIDPYHYLRLARNYLDHGNIGDKKVAQGRVDEIIVYDKWWDTHMVAPAGMWSYGEEEAQPYVLAYIYKIAKIFNPKIPLMQAAAYFPIIFVTLAVICAFLFARKLTNNIGGIFASLLLGINAAALGRTQWGHADTDAHNLFFPMLISWLFVESTQAETNLKRYLLISANCAAILLYSVTWSGWWYVFDFLLAALGVQVVYTILLNRAKFKEAILTFSAYFFGTLALFVTFRTTLEGTVIGLFFNNILGPLNFSLLKAASHANLKEHLFPNVYTTVAELNPTSIWGAIDSGAGGDLFILIGAIGLVLLLTKKSLPRYKRAMYSTFLTLWIVATLYATTNGIRFAILTAPAIAALFGVSAGEIYEKLVEFNKKTLHLKQAIIAVFVVLLFGIIIIHSGEVEKANSQSRNDMPILNKAWIEALTAIKENSSQDAIINSWWDFGHHFKYLADRAVTFDGASQNSPMAHWIGKTLSTKNEDEAIGLLRMLDCGSRFGYDEIFSATNQDTIKSIRIMNDLVKIKKKQDAAKYLESKNIKNTEKILNYTHCTPPEDFFITSEDMVSKAGVWSHFGMWNFEKAYVWQNLRNTSEDQAVKEMMQKFDYTKQTAQQIYAEVQSLQDEGAANTWISNWAGYASGFDSCDVTNETIICGNGIKINKTTMDTTITFDQGTAHPRYVSYIDEKTLKFTVKEFNNSPAPFAVVVVPSGNIYRAIITSPEHADSIFTRLFYMEGHGLKNFKLFNRQHQLIGGGEIYVWKIDWEGKEQNVIETLKDKNKKA